MKKLYSIMLLAFTISNIYAGTITKTVNVTTPGTLTNLLTTDEKISILNLTVTGNIDARDFVCIRDEVRNITVLDLRNSDIKEYNGVWGTDIIDFITFYPENEIPRRSFSGLSRYNDAKYNYILKTVYLPNSATSIGSLAFYQCPELTDVIIGNSVTSIKDYAFRWSSKLKSISIPQSVSTIGFGSFMDNYGLTEIKVNTNNQYFSSIDGVLFNKNQTKLISYPSGKLGTYIIPNTVKVIDWLAFFRCLKITDVIFPNSLDSIQGGAFEECYNLNSILNLTSVSFIGTQAFMRTGIKSVITGNKLKKIQSSTFKYCTSLKKVRLGNSIVEIENDAFANCPQLTTINIPNSVRKIGSWEAPNVTIINSAFGESGLTSCVIPSSVDTIGSSTYKSCFDLWTVYNYRSTPYERCPFSFLSGRNYTLYVPEGTSNKYKSANDWNKFTNIIEMTTTKVINISIAGTLKTYFNTNELKTINKLTIAGNIDARDIRFIRDEIPMLEFLDISGTNIQEYYGNEGTNNTIMSYPSNELPSNSFENFNDTSLIYNLDLINIKLPNTITSIGKKAFAFCGGLRSISIPSTVATIKDSVFYECNHLNRLICMNITPPEINDEIILSCPISTIFVPVGRTETYKASTIWGSIPNILEYKLT